MKAFKSIQEKQNFFCENKNKIKEILDEFLTLFKYKRPIIYFLVNNILKALIFELLEMYCKDKADNGQTDDN